jgi:hypothetical protein
VGAQALSRRLFSGAGQGSIELGAFDAALMGAGVANDKLRCLSSVIPRMRAQAGCSKANDGRGLLVELHDADRDRLEADLHATLGRVRCGDRRADADRLEPAAFIQSIV